MRRLLTARLFFLMGALLIVVSLVMYGLVQKDLRRRSLFQMSSQVRQHWNPKPIRQGPPRPPHHGPPRMRWHLPMLLRPMPAPRSLGLTTVPGHRQDWDQLSSPQIHLRYYDLQLRLQAQRGGPPEAPEERKAELAQFLASGQETLEFRSKNAFENWLMWAHLVRDPQGKPVGVLELGLGTRPTEELLELMGGSLTLAALAAMLLGFAVSSALARQLCEPLESLARQMQAVSQGDFQARAEQRGPFELQAIAMNFNRMVGHIQSVFQAQRRFVADASHELKTPLTSVQTMVELLEEHPEMTAEKRQRAFHVIDRELTRVQRLVHDLLALSRLDEGERLAEPVDLVPLIQTLGAEYAAHHPGVVVNSAETSALASLVDPGAGERAIRNLLDNALAHSEEAGRIDLKLSRQGQRFLLEVADQGSGIPAEDLPHIMRRFYRSDQSRSRLSGGSGLGLAIVSSWVEQTGGEISIDSTLGEGTVVRLWLPAADNHEP